MVDEIEQRTLDSKGRVKFCRYKSGKKIVQTFLSNGNIIITVTENGKSKEYVRTKPMV